MIWSRQLTRPAQARQDICIFCSFFRLGATRTRTHGQVRRNIPSSQRASHAFAVAANPPSSDGVSAVPSTGRGRRVGAFFQPGSAASVESPDPNGMQSGQQIRPSQRGQLSRENGLSSRPSYQNRESYNSATRSSSFDKRGEISNERDASIQGQVQRLSTAHLPTRGYGHDDTQSTKISDAFRVRYVGDQADVRRAHSVGAAHNDSSSTNGWGQLPRKRDPSDMSFLVRKTEGNTRTRPPQSDFVSLSRRAPRYCYICKAEDHVSRDCPERERLISTTAPTEGAHRSSTAQSSKPLKCYICNEVGHSAGDCTR